MTINHTYGQLIRRSKERGKKKKTLCLQVMQICRINPRFVRLLTNT